jgi:hypothetical protein
MARLIPKVTSLVDLFTRAAINPRYAKLAIVAAQNLGRNVKTIDEARAWLNLNAMETTERGVVGEVNHCRDLVTS